MASSRKNRRGRCHTCGQLRDLTFEHVPPQKCFNNTRATIFDFFDWRRQGTTPTSGGEIEQRGFGRYTLCGRCNNNTGSWYGDDFVRWSLGAIRLWVRVPEAATAVRFSVLRLYPLRILKQVVSMMLSVGSSDFVQKEPEVTAFLLDRESHLLPGKFRVGMFLWKGEIGRHVGLAGMFNADTGIKRVLSEITGRPFGYTFHVWGNPLPDQCYIEDWKRFGYNECVDMNLCIPIHHGNTPYPGVYLDRPLL